MNVIEVNPRGLCHGVVSAMQLVSSIIGDPNTKQPIYIIGDIVHNENISRAYDKRGAITLNGKNRREIIDKVSSGSIIITAHGIDPHLIDYAKNRGLDVYDATCKDVTKTHEIIKKYLALDYDIIYVGKHGHPEPEAAVGIDTKHVHLVSNQDDLNNLILENDKIILTNQTTLSMWSLQDLISLITEKYPQTEVIKEICDATKLRQEAVLESALKADLTIVVGDLKSNNTNKLVEISEELANTKAIRINSLDELDISYLLDESVNNVAITAGASTPSLLTKDVINFVKSFDKEDILTHDIEYSIDLNRIIPRSKKNV